MKTKTRIPTAPVIGITGGIASGKSALLARLADLHPCHVIHADDVARELSLPGQPCFQPLVDLLGPSILAPDGTIDRPKMAALIFADDNLRAAVNAIIHPAVKAAIIASLHGGGAVAVIFIEAALLIEDGYGKIVDELWYVYADEATRVERLRRDRGYSPEKISAIIASQLPDAEYRRHCQLVIDNSGDLETAISQVTKHLTERNIV